MLRQLIFVVILISLQALAESPSVTLQALKSMQKAETDAERLCQHIKENPTCKDDLEHMRTTLGLSVQSCLAQREAAQCDAFIAKFPEYKAKQMNCEPYEVCKLALNQTFAEGCRRYGIEVKNSFIQLLQKTRVCFSEASCRGRYFITALYALLNPLQTELRIAMRTTENISQDFINDKDKFKSLACLDPETQMQFGCYLTMKYGSAIIGTAGLVNSLRTKMAKIEADLLAVEVKTSSTALKENFVVSTREALTEPAPESKRMIGGSKLTPSEQNLQAFMPRSYQYTEDIQIASQNRTPVFNVAGVNSSKDLARVKSIAGEPIKDLTDFMKACKSSWEKGVKGSCLGFIKEQDDLRKVLIKDNDFVQSKGLTHQQIAEPLLDLMQQFEKLKYADTKPKSLVVSWKGRQYEIIGNRRIEGSIFKNELAHSGWIGEARSNDLQGSPFHNDQIYNTWEFRIKDLQTGEVFKGEGLTPHLIYRYGFYQNGPFRMDPAMIIDFFHLR